MDIMEAFKIWKELGNTTNSYDDKNNNYVIEFINKSGEVVGNITTYSGQGIRRDINMTTKWIVYSRYGLQSHGFETANKVNFLTCNLKDETLYNTMEEAKDNTDEFYSNVCEVSSLYEISKHILH